MAEEVKAPESEKAEIPWLVAYLGEDIQEPERRGSEEQVEHPAIGCQD